MCTANKYGNRISINKVLNTYCMQSCLCEYFRGRGSIASIRLSMEPWNGEEPLPFSLSTENGKPTMARRSLLRCAPFGVFGDRRSLTSPRGNYCTFSISSYLQGERWRSTHLPVDTKIRPADWRPPPEGHCMFGGTRNCCKSQASEY